VNSDQCHYYGCAAPSCVTYSYSSNSHFHTNDTTNWHTNKIKNKHKQTFNRKYILLCIIFGSAPVDRLRKVVHHHHEIMKSSWKYPSWFNQIALFTNSMLFDLIILFLFPGTRTPDNRIIVSVILPYTESLTCCPIRRMSVVSIIKRYADALQSDTLHWMNSKLLTLKKITLRRLRQLTNCMVHGTAVGGIDATRNLS